MINSIKYYFEKYKIEFPNINELRNKNLLITGVTGLIGKFFVHYLYLLNIEYDLNLKVVGIGRDKQKSNEIFKEVSSNFYSFIECDLSKINDISDLIKVTIDYIIHGASNTHPLQYSGDPIGTITTNIFGTYSLLEFAKKHNVKKMLLSSSVEIYGDCPNYDKIKETDLGYINSNSLRAGYPESKRLSESLCAAYKESAQIDYNILRFSRVYGHTMKKSDSKAISQFLLKGIQGEDIILKSKGDQFFSFCNVFDAVTATIYILLNGKSCEEYNISSKKSDVSLKDLAKIIAQTCKVDLSFELPNDFEKKGYSKASRAVLSCEKLNSIGWESMVDLKEGIKETIKHLKLLNN